MTPQNRRSWWRINIWPAVTAAGIGRSLRLSGVYTGQRGIGLDPTYTGKSFLGYAGISEGAEDHRKKDSVFAYGGNALVFRYFAGIK